MSATEPSFPWPKASASAIGSYPGDDPDETMRIVLGELPDLPHLPELPARGPGADLIGRTAGLLVDLAVELQPSGWRFADRPGRDLRRGRDHLARDLDVLEQQAAGPAGPFKIQVCGPWTLAAGIELRSGNRTLKDPGAVRDLIDSLAEGVAAHVADVRRRAPGAEILLQLDEPGLPAVLAGRIPTASGLSRLRPVEPAAAEHGLRTVLAAGGAFPLVHCCAPDVPYGLLRAAGAKAIAVDLGLVPDRADDEIGEAIEAGIGLLLGAVPALPAQGASGRPDPAAAAEAIRRLWRRLGFPPESIADQVVVTPACGLAGASPPYARAALAGCAETARRLHEAATG